MALSERLPEPPTVSLADLLGDKRPVVEGSSDLDLEHYVEEILASGFPGLRAFKGRMLRMQLDSYLQRVADRDFRDLDHPIRNPVTLRRWLTAYAAATSTTTSFEKIRDASTPGESDKPAKSTVLAYRDVLERLWLLDPVPGWKPTRSHISRLTLPPKHHLADPALAARLLGAGAGSLLDGRPLGPSVPRDGTLLGSLFESLVTLSIRVYAQSAEARVWHLRTFAGEREIDLIVERDDGRVVAFEVKLGGVVGDHDVRHLTWLADQIGDELLDAVVITTGPEAYRRPDGVAVVPAALLGP